LFEDEQRLPAPAEFVVSFTDRLDLILQLLFSSIDVGDWLPDYYPLVPYFPIFSISLSKKSNPNGSFKVDLKFLKKASFLLHLLILLESRFGLEKHLLINALLFPLEGGCGITSLSISIESKLF
jgi:hypothetical protein